MSLENGEYYTTLDGNGEEKSSSGHGWIIALFIILAIIAVIVILVVIFGPSEERKLLQVNGVEFNVPTDGTIQATWTSTGNSEDELVLYVIPNDGQMTFNSAGEPQGAYLNSGSPSPSTAGSIPSTTPSSARVASVTGLKEGTYSATLVVTNPVVPDRSFTQNSKSLPVKTSTIPVIFSITAAGQSGAIRYEPASTPTEVGYEIGKINPSNNSFHQDSTGRICAAGAGSWTSSSLCDSGSRVLYADTTNKLAIGEYEPGDVGSEITTANSEWTYTNGKWCLKNNPTNCMSYNKNNPITDITTLSVMDEETTPTIQTITITTSSDVNKWTNQQIVK